MSGVRICFEHSAVLPLSYANFAECLTALTPVYNPNHGRREFFLVIDRPRLIKHQRRAECIAGEDARTRETMKCQQSAVERSIGIWLSAERHETLRIFRGRVSEFFDHGASCKSQRRASCYYDICWKTIKFTFPAQKERSFACERVSALCST